MDFLVYSRAVSGAGERGIDPALNEEHWSYMDRFANGMIARGPTLATDRETWTGSLHILDLPSAEAARQFVELEPYNRAGLFEQHLIRRFDNLLGRTMWDVSEASDHPRFLVIAQAPPTPGEHTAAVPLGISLPARERLIIHGDLLTEDDAWRVGVVLAIQARTRPTVDALLSGGQALLDGRGEVQILDWELGGRR
jgi:uncharacterized protein YciI